MLDIRGVDELVEIGRGGTSVVYRGMQQNFNRSVAVKVFDLTLQRDIDRERFRRECRAIGSLSGHPNIVTVFDEGVLEDGRPYLVMEHLPLTLADELANGGRFTWQQAAEIGITLSAALSAAHNAGILHRDVKPENVLLTNDGVPKLTDFGLAQVAGGFESKTSTVRASLSHASPELIEGAPVSAASDVYSLASTLHHLVAGKPPFVQNESDSLVRIISRIVRDDPPSLTEFDVPEELEELLRTAMSKDPASRPQDVRAFAEALDDVLGERPRRNRYSITNQVRVTTDSLAPIAVKTTRERRKRQIVIVLALAAMIGATAAVVATTPRQHRDPGPGTGTTDSTTSTTSSTTTTTIGAVPTETLATILGRDYPRFSELMQTAGLMTRLQNTGPNTVFALPDTALAEESWEQLGADDALAYSVMSYHTTESLLLMSPAPSKC